MSQISLFEEKAKENRPALPSIYAYRNLPINRKINYKSAPMFKYGDKRSSTIECVYGNQVFIYGLCRVGLDYSLEPVRDNSKAIKKRAKRLLREVLKQEAA